MVTVRLFSNPTEVAKTLRPWIDMESSGCDLSMLDALVRRDVLRSRLISTPQLLNPEK